MLTLEFAQQLIVAMALFCPGSLMVVAIAFVLYIRASAPKQYERKYIELEGVDKAWKGVIAELVKDGWKVISVTQASNVDFYDISLTKVEEKPRGLLG